MYTMKNGYIDAIISSNSLSDTGITDVGKHFQVLMAPR